MTSSTRLQAAFAAACLRREAGFEEDLAGFLAGEGIAREDIEALLAMPRRLGLYRRLVRANVFGVIEQILPRTKARMEQAVPGLFDASIAAFLDETGPRTPHLRDVPGELLAHAQPRWRAEERLPPWIGEFAELERIDFAIGTAPRPAPAPPLAEVSADRPLVFAEPKRLLRLGWTVHAERIEAREVALLVYRDDEHQTRYLELTSLAARILERLLSGETLGEAMVAGCRDADHPLDGSVLEGAARLLADLGERGVLLGARG